jgi:hypothetical protein
MPYPCVGNPIDDRAEGHPLGAGHPVTRRRRDPRVPRGRAAPWAGALLPALVLAAAMLCPGAARALPSLPSCSWPIETTGTGLSNVAYPDTDATYWTMPFDTSRWKALVIAGTYPEARFFSFTSYDTKGSLVDGIVDVDIKPDRHSRNPFKPGVAKAGAGDKHVFGRSYTVTVSPRKKAAKGANHLDADDASLGWVLYRVYVPDNGENRAGGVDLPAVTLIAHDGTAHPLSPCTFPDFAAAATSVIAELEAGGFDDAASFIATKALAEGDDGGAGPGGTCAPDKVAFAIPQNTGGYFPNPANKYIAAPDLCFQQDRIVVVRGKGAVFPDTYNGDPVWLPPAPGEKIALRYWSMCNNDQTSPYPVVDCRADWATNLDGQGYYTYVVAEGVLGLAPPWLPANATWLPWGSKLVPNILIFRNMLPAAGFRQSVQAATVPRGCEFVNEAGVPVPYPDIVAAGVCDRTVMGAYYPVAAYCDKTLFIAQGWQGCFAAAGIAGL